MKKFVYPIMLALVLVLFGGTVMFTNASANAQPSADYAKPGARIEAEDTSFVTFSSGDKNITDTPKASGGATWNGFWAINDTAKIRINAPSAGIYYMTARYSVHHSHQDKTAILQVTGSEQSKVITFSHGLDKSENWQYYRTITHSVELNSGNNEISLTMNGGEANGMMFDYFQFDKLGLSTVKFQADNAENVIFSSGHVDTDNCPNAEDMRTWTGFAAAGETLTTTINSSSVVKAELTIRYSHHHSRASNKKAQITANSASTNIDFEPGLNNGTNWDNYKTVTNTVNLIIGENNIVITVLPEGNQDDMQIDYIEFKARGEQGKASTPTLKHADTTSIELNPIELCEYSKDGANWQDSPLFTGLTKKTQYNFYARLKETDLLLSGIVSDVATFETLGNILVSFNTTGGTPIATQEIIQGTKAARPQDSPTKKSYTFIDWYQDAELTILFDFEQIINGDTNIYAKWSKNHGALAERIEAENDDINLFNGVKRNETGENSVYYGIYHFGNVSYWLETNVNVDKAGKYRLIVSYSKNTKANTSFENTEIICPIYINGNTTKNADIILADTGDTWSSYKEVYVDINLEAGVNSIKLEPTSATVGSSMIDWLMVDYQSPQMSGEAIASNAKVGVALTPYTINVTGVDGGIYTLSLKSGSILPSGLTLTNGIISGTPTQSGEFSFTVLATADNGKTAEAVFSVNIGKGAQAKVNAPTLKQATTTSIELNIIEVCEYSKDGINWQDSPLFTGLTKNVKYDFFARLKETTAYDAGTISDKASFRTLDTFTITFAVDGGSNIANQEITQGEKIIKPSASPSKTGYDFVNWYQDAELTILFDFEQEINSVLIVYAKWTKQTVTITFNAMGGSEVVENVCDYGTIVALTTPTKNGYTFDGWYTSDDSGATLNTIFDVSKPITASITLYAKWIKNEVTPPADKDEKKGCGSALQNTDSLSSIFICSIFVGLILIIQKRKKPFNNKL